MPQTLSLIQEAVVRFFVFLGIAGLVAYFAARLVRVQKETRRVSDIQESTLMNANVLLMLLDAGGKVLIWNNAAERITGYAAAEVTGRTISGSFCIRRRNTGTKSPGKITKIIGENNFFENLETTIRCRNGDRKVISWNTRRIPGSDDKDDRYIAIGDRYHREQAGGGCAEGVGGEVQGHLRQLE